MIAIRHKDAAQNGYEASIRCLQNKSQPFTLPKNEKPPELQTKFHDQLVLDPKHLSCTEILESSEECTQHVIYNPDSAPWFANPDVNYVPQWILYPLHGQVQPFPVNYPIQYAPSNVYPSVYPYEYQLQDFQFFVVIDFEATCDRGKIPNPQEIIEFPSVIVSSISGQLEACFQTYVRPTCNQVLSDFCKELTGIQQIQVDRGVTLSEALLRHDKWLEKRGIKNANFAVVTWSDWDCQVMLESECRYKNIRKPTYFNRWINLRVPFQQVFGGTRCNLKEAVEMAGLTWQGRAHCGLDDAKNTANLLALLMHRGFKFSITSSLTSPYNNDGSFTKWKPTPETPPYTPSQPQKPAEFQVPHPHHYCYCGVKSSKGMVKKPGPKQGSVFFGCGNWTVNRGARCQYFEWASQ